MKTKLSLLIATIATSITLTYLQSEPTLAQSKQRFYCGSTDQQEPATMLVTQGQREEKTFVVWRTKTKDCKSVSRLFQKALEQGNKFFAAGETRGKGFVCGVKSKGKSCLAKDTLFEVDNKSQAQEFANQLNSGQSIEQ
jgi:Circadian oscillating protein COP23